MAFNVSGFGWGQTKPFASTPRPMPKIKVSGFGWGQTKPFGMAHPGAASGLNPAPNALPAKPAAPGAPPASGPSALDAAYWANVNANQYKTTGDVNALNLQSSQAAQALQAALGQLAYQQPRDELKLMQQTNARGGLYSSVYGQNLGNLNAKYVDQGSANLQKYGGQETANAAKISALQEGVPLYNAQQAAGAAQRATALAQSDASLGLGVATPKAPAPKVPLARVAPKAKAPKAALKPILGFRPGNRTPFGTRHPGAASGLNLGG